MQHIDFHTSLVGRDDLILVTGAGGFIGTRLVARLLELGFTRVRCLARQPLDASKFNGDASAVEVVQGNLLSRVDCATAVKDAAVIFHLAAGRGEKSYPDAFLNSVVTTRNLLDASLAEGALRRFVNVSSFAVYSNVGKPRRGLLDESCPVEPRPDLRGDAYSFAKVKQDEIVTEYGRERGLPYVIVRPGYVYGPGRDGITGRVGMSPFGVFMHLGGSNTIPFTFVDNCVEALVRAGITRDVDGHVFNVVDDELPTSRRFLRQYKRHVRPFRSIYVPHAASYALCRVWEWYSEWSDGQLPPLFNRRSWHAYWKRTRYSNDKIKTLLGWTQPVPTPEAFDRYFRSCREKRAHA